MTVTRSVSSGPGLLPVPHATIESYMEIYLQMNHVLYISCERNLRQAFRELVETRRLQENSVVEFCLVLALGSANSSGEACREERRRISQFWLGEALNGLHLLGKFISKLPLMRILTLLSLYRLETCRDTALRLLGKNSVLQPEGTDRTTDMSALALKIGRANGLETEAFPLSSLHNEERTQWLRLWESLRFLHTVSIHYILFEFNTYRS